VLEEELDEELELDDEEEDEDKLDFSDES